jgi:signal transduction histidine kinase
MTGHDIRTTRLTLSPLPAQLGILLPTLAALLYVWLAGPDLEPTPFRLSVGVGLLLGAASLVTPRRMDPTMWQVLLALPGVALLYPLLVVSMDVDVRRFGVVVALIVLIASYAFAGRLRVAVNAWVLVVWAVSLHQIGITQAAEVVLQLGGVGLLAVATTRIADVLVASIHEAAEARGDAQRRASLLAALLRSDALDPAEVLRSATSGLADAGFDVAVIRLIDPVAGTARRLHGHTFRGLVLPEVIPSGRGLLGRAVSEGRTFVVDDLRLEPAAVDLGVGLRGAVVIPLRDDGEVIAVLSGASASGALDPEQLQAAERLADQAERALARARAFAADRRAVTELRRLDVRTRDFVSTVSHELRTPLTVISGLGETLRARWEDLSAQQRAQLLHRIDANAERLGVMVRSLLDTSAFEEGELEIDRQVVGVRDSIVALLDRMASITTSHPIALLVPPELRVEVDPGLFEHVLENLLTNVAKHTPPGTRVEVSAVRRGDRVEVAVADEGPGIPAADLPHVLDRFYRGGEPDRRASGGLGLGLALARQVVEAHGSELRVESTEGEGTRFSFEVPAGG